MKSLYLIEKQHTIKMESKVKIPYWLWWLLGMVPVVSAGIACLQNPCLHGICIDDVNSMYSCYCVDGYTGVQCQTNWDECWSDPCQNGGTCVDGIASYNCTCPEGFIGDNCEINYDECASNPCLNNGTCIDMTNGYVCSCVPGYSGEHCELDIAVCNLTEEVRCHNGGQCIEGPGFKFYCRCSPGWAGKQCEDQIDECESDPCQNGGVCIDVHADYMCACPYGFTGKSCEFQIEFCEKNSCDNNAICVIEDGMRVCYCVPDFHGERCELQYDECMLGPGCMNGGTCIDGIDNFTCSCPPRLTGHLCECLILNDGSYDCQYVNPTPLPSFNQSVFFTTLHEDITTTDMTSTAYPAGYNDTIPRTPVVVIDGKINASTTTIYETTTIQESMDTTTENPIEETETIAKETSTIPTDITPLKVDSTSTQEPASKHTIDSGDSKIETTTECKESCENITEVTTKVPLEDTTTSAETTKSITTSTQAITDIPLKPTTIGETTVNIVTEITIKDTKEVITTPKVDTTTENITTKDSREDITPLIVDTATERTTTKDGKEVITSPRVDTTTEKLFTDAPTEHPIIDGTTPHTSATDEVTTLFETTTYSNIVEEECNDSICNEHGKCINTPHGIRCHCNFNYGGKFCEEKVSITSAAFAENSFITHQIENSSSINIIFNAKTLLSDGQIMHVDITRGLYMQLYIHSGQLMFKFSCGYQTMLLSELNMFVNKGYPMKIESRLDLYLKEQHCNATLLLNDTAAMSGDQIANVTALGYNTTLYLGNWNSTKGPENKPFIGCIRDLVVNGEKREIFGDALNGEQVTECSSLSCLSNPCYNGGSCSDHGENYTCSCANGWMGEHCNQSVCEHNPCQFGGSCIKHPGSGFLCLCPYGKHGIFCEYNVEITRPSLAPISSGISSYLVYPLSPSAMNSDRFDLRMRFQTTDMDQIALLAFVGQNGRHDSRSQHLALTFVKGYVMMTWNMGNGARRIFTSRALTPRRGGHTVRVWRRGRSGGFTVDGRHNSSGNAPASDNKMSLLPYIFIGGHPSEDFHDLPHDLPLHTGWRGCVWEVGGQAVGGGRAVGGRGVGQCGVAQCTAKSCNAPRGVCIHSPATYGCICNEGWFGATCAVGKSPCDRSVSLCRGKCVVTAGPTADCDCPYGTFGVNCEQALIPTDVYFTGIRSYAKLHDRPLSSVSLSLEAEIRPTKERGLLVFVRTPHFYTALSLQGGLLEYRWTDRLSGVTSLVRSGVVVSVSQWHSVKAGRYGSRLYVWADGSLSTEAMQAHAYPHTSTNASITVGGAKDLAALPFEAMSGPPESYTGCLRNLHVNNVILPLEPQNILEGQNLGDCDGTPCGAEMCGGGACVVEDGRARCACAGTGASGSTNGGSRCRRHIGCSKDACVPPAGVCRNGACVCSAGFAGDYCEKRINVTIPQFNGDSLLSLGRNSETASKIGEQRLGDNVRPSYIAFNFTTAEPNGLLLWIDMDTDYLGLGLENGYIKFARSVRQDSSDLEVFSTKDAKTTENSRTFSRLVPQAGYLTDAEWHIVVLNLGENNVSLTVDGLLAYVEEPGLTHGEYDHVDMFIGGINREKSSKGIRLFPQNLKGCIGDIRTQEESPITNYTDVYSENINSCQLFP